MGNTPIQLGIKTHKQTYQYGETMTGTVYLSVTSLNDTTQHYQGIHLSFAGHETTEVKIRQDEGGSGRHNRTTTSYRTERESTLIVQAEVPLRTFTSPLRVAQYEFPFEWKLPNHNTPLPSSFRHDDDSGGGNRKGYCEVCYTLTAFLVSNKHPQKPPGMLGSFFDTTNNNGNNNSGTVASQQIHFLGPPTRYVPEPLCLADERTTIHGLCCCWNQGAVDLGWEAESIVLAPESTCELRITGHNASRIDITKLRIQLVQSVSWQASPDRHSRNSTLVDYTVDVSQHPQWKAKHPTSSSNNSNHYQTVQPQSPQRSAAVQDEDDDYYEDEIVPEKIATSFLVPPDVLDSYTGRNCRVEHTLIVSAETRFLATTPKVPFQIHIQRSTITPTMPTAEIPVATAWINNNNNNNNDTTVYQDVVLPADWSPEEKVPTIHLDQIHTAPAPQNTDYIDHNHVALATAQAVAVVPADDDEEEEEDEPFTITDNDDDDDDNVVDEDDPLAFARPAGIDLDNT